MGGLSAVACRLRVYLCYKMIQLIKRKPIIFRVRNTDYEFVKPNYLMPLKKFRLIKAKVKGSTMVWNIEGTTVSYNQIRFLIKSNKKF